MEVVKGLTQHSIVLCLEKQERGITLTTILKQKGFKVFQVGSLYDALKYAEQEMPHLIISDAILTDGTVATIYDRLAQNPTLQNTPIMVLVAKKTKEHLMPLTGRKFAGFLLGQFDGNQFVSKIHEILASNQDLSPYFTPFETTTLARELTLSAKATALGVKGDQVVYKSEAEIDSSAAIVCLPFEKDKGPALLQMGTNVVKGKEVYNLFPISRIRGKGRVWIEKLPQVDLEGGGQQGKRAPRRALFCDPNVQRTEQFKEILAGYDVELIGVTSFQAAIATMQRDSGGIKCVYFHEVAGPQLTSLRDTLSKMGEKNRMPVIVGTTSLNMRSTPEIRYIQKPFGLGVLVETMEAAFLASGAADDFAGAGAAANFEVDFQAPAKIVGLDETGGILEVKFPMARGSRVKLNHAELKPLWGEEAFVQITASGQLSADVWHVRFESIAGNENKAKYWVKVRQFLDQFSGVTSQVA